MLVFLFGVTKGTAAEGGMYKCFIHSLLLFFKNQLVEEQPNTKFWKRNPPFVLTLFQTCVHYNTCILSNGDAYLGDTEANVPQLKSHNEHTTGTKLFCFSV